MEAATAPDRALTPAQQRALQLQAELERFIAIVTEKVQPERIIHVPVALLRLLALVLDRGTRGRWSERVERATEDRSVDNSGLVAATGLHPRDFPTGLADMLRHN